MTRIFIGTSGFSYPNWHEIGSFYPPNHTNELGYYSSIFNFVEINYSFYKEPSILTIQEWKKAVPKDFKFSLKVHKYFTHVKRLNVDKMFEKRWDSFWGKCITLKPKLGPILFQLPPIKFTSVGKNSMKARLIRLSEILPKNEKFVFECRDSSWDCEEVRDLFKKYNWCMCYINLNNNTKWADEIETGYFPQNDGNWLTAKWGLYYRFHGNEGQYFGEYKKQTLNAVFKKIKLFAEKRKQIFIAFNNIDNKKPSSAIRNANYIVKLHFK